MCGIAGFTNLGGHNKTPETLVNMLSMIRYRGPDATGIYIDDYIGLMDCRIYLRFNPTPDGGVWFHLQSSGIYQRKLYPLPRNDRHIPVSRRPRFILSDRYPPACYPVVQRGFPHIRPPYYRHCWSAQLKPFSNYHSWEPEDEGFINIPNKTWNSLSINFRYSRNFPARPTWPPAALFAREGGFPPGRRPPIGSCKVSLPPPPHHGGPAAGASG